MKSQLRFLIVCDDEQGLAGLKHLISETLTDDTA